MEVTIRGYIRIISVLLLVILSLHFNDSLICYNCSNCDGNFTNPVTCGSGVQACAYGYGYLENGTKMSLRDCTNPSTLGSGPDCKFIPAYTINGAKVSNITICFCKTDYCNDTFQTTLAPTIPTFTTTAVNPAFSTTTASGVSPTTTASGVSPTTTASGVSPTTTASGVSTTTTVGGVSNTTSRGVQWLGIRVTLEFGFYFAFISIVSFSMVELNVR